MMLPATSLQVLFMIVFQLEGIHLFQIRHQNMRSLNPISDERLPSQWRGVSLFNGASQVVQRQASDADLINNTDPVHSPLQVPASPH